MFFSILKKDLIRRRTMNTILLLFIVIASMFTGSGTANLLAVWGGLGSFFEMAQTGDAIIFFAGDYDRDETEKILNHLPEISSFRSEEGLYYYDCLNDKSGQKSSSTPPLFIPQSKQSEKIFDENNHEITDIEEGHVWLCNSYMNLHGLNPGDTITVDIDGMKLPLVIDGIAKDAVFGNVQMLTMVRFILNDKDYEKIASCPTFRDHSLFNLIIYYVECDNVKALETHTSRLKGLLFFNSTNTLMAIYIMDLMTSFLLIVLSVALILISFLVLNFSVTFTLNEEFREIGILKALGIKNINIRLLCMIKYSAIALLGSLIGFFAGIPLEDVLLKNSSRSIVIITITAYAWICTGKLNRFTPLDAIRFGQSGERFTIKKGMRIPDRKLPVPLFLAINDIICSPRRYLTILLSFYICAHIVLTIDNVSSTLKSDSLLDTLIGKADVVCDFSREQMLKNMELTASDDMDIYTIMDEYEERFNEDGIPCRVSMCVMEPLFCEINGKTHLYTAQAGMNYLPEDRSYYAGSGPENPNEIAISLVIAEEYGLSIGDTIKLDYGQGAQDVVICGLFQCLTNLGYSIRIAEHSPDIEKYNVTSTTININFTDSPDNKEIKRRIELLGNNYGFLSATAGRDFCAISTGAAKPLDAVKKMMFSIMLFVIILVSVLMERTFITGDKNEIALLKATGMRASSLIAWHMIRFAIVTLISVMLAAVISIPSTTFAVTPVFASLGVSHPEFRYNYINIFLLYPAIVLVINLASVFLTSLSMKGIKSSDISNIE
jgi:putative ABC transport system permease protein